MKNNPLSGEIPALTGIRAIAAYMVFLRHYPIFNNDGGYQSILAGLFNEFHTGVTFFFVLSGFLIAHLYYDKASLSKNFLGEFYIKRFARIYPVFFLLTALTFFIGFLQHENGSNFSRFLLNISFAKGFSQNTFFSGLITSWSLTVEVCFYLLAPFIFVLMRRAGLFVWQVVALLLIGFVLVQLSLQYHSVHFFNDYSFILSSTFFGRSFEFFAGIGLALYIRNNHDKITQRLESKKRFPVFTAVSILLLLLMYACMIGICYWQNVATSVNWIGGAILNNYLLPLPIVLLLYGLITEQSILKNIFSCNIFQLLGKSSYCFYLVHVGIIADAFFGLIHTGSHPLNMLLVFCILNILSILIYHFVENPLQRHLRTDFFARIVYFAKVLTIRLENGYKYYILRRNQLQ